MILHCELCVPMVKYEMLGLTASYGLSYVKKGLSTISYTVWSCFGQRVQLYYLLCLRLVSFHCFLCVYCIICEIRLCAAYFAFSINNNFLRHFFRLQLFEHSKTC